MRRVTGSAQAGGLRLEDANVTFTLVKTTYREHFEDEALISPKARKKSDSLLEEPSESTRDMINNEINDN